MTGDFVNVFTNDPLNFGIPKNATLIGVNSNPFQEDEYVVTYWLRKE